jgi:hypothetical protein
MKLEQWMALAAQAPLATLAAPHMDAERLAQGLEGTLAALADMPAGEAVACLLDALAVAVLTVHAGSGEAVARALRLRMEHLQALAESLP